jgi:RP/EB family microtubule-associated protein
MGESRTELLSWLNDLLQLGYTKIEQCGTGAAHCQIIDSIYRDIPVGKVKFNTRQEYEYIQNFKILQNAFDKHKIDNGIPVERLVKCKFQDNIEFLQWMKKYWDQFYPGGSYDALGRRKNAGVDGGAFNMASAVAAGPARSVMPVIRTTTSTANGIKKSISNSSVNDKATPIKPIARSAIAGRIMPSTGTHASAGLSGRERAELETEYQRSIGDLTQQALQLKLNVDQVEKERDFYFGKLREIEIFVQQLLEGESAIPSDVLEKLKEIQAIMYKTEDGFEVPEGAEAENESY